MDVGNQKSQEVFLQKILGSNSAFIILIMLEINPSPIEMNQEEILLTEMLEKVGDRISKEVVAEKVSQFIKYGNVFLFFELMSLRKEIERIKEEIPSVYAYTRAHKQTH